MLHSLPYTVTPELLKEATQYINSMDYKTSINAPAGRFFYDPWTIVPMYKDTPLDAILQSLPFGVGEARIINLPPGNCYQIHSDIDDRYHLNISGEYAYLVDLKHDIMHRVQQDCTWYEMDAGRVHSAINFGRDIRTQLVVRKLLNDVTLNDPVSVKITSTLPTDHARFLFDNIVSEWLNVTNKLRSLSHFAHNGVAATFNAERRSIPSLQAILTSDFILEVK